MVHLEVNWWPQWSLRVQSQSKAAHLPHAGRTLEGSHYKRMHGERARLNAEVPAEELLGRRTFVNGSTQRRSMCWRRVRWWGQSEELRCWHLVTTSQLYLEPNDARVRDFLGGASETCPCVQHGEFDGCPQNLCLLSSGQVEAFLLSLRTKMSKRVRCLFETVDLVFFNRDQRFQDDSGKGSKRPCKHGFRWNTLTAVVTRTTR